MRGGGEKGRGREERRKDKRVRRRRKKGEESRKEREGEGRRGKEREEEGRRGKEREGEGRRGGITIIISLISRLSGGVPQTRLASYRLCHASCHNGHLVHTRGWRRKDIPTVYIVALKSGFTVRSYILAYVNLQW